TLPPVAERMPSQWALPLPHRTGQSSPRRRFVHAVFTALDRNHVLDVLPDQLTAGQAAVSPLDQARVEAPRGHAPVDVGPRIEQLHLSVIVNLMNAAVGTNPPKAAQSALGPLWLVVVLGGDTDGHRIVRCPLSSGATHRADRHLVHFDAEGRVLLEHPIGLVLSGRVPLLEVAPVE